MVLSDRDARRPEVRIDGAEVVDARWLSPPGALAAGRREEILLVFPTIKHLEQLSMFGSVHELLAHAREQTVRPVQPRIVGEGEQARIVLPGEPGYDTGSAMTDARTRAQADGSP